MEQLKGEMKMEFKQNKFDGSCKIYFSKDEIDSINKNKYLFLTDIFLRHFGNNLVRIVSDWNSVFRQEVKDLDTKSFKVEPKVFDGQTHSFTNYVREYDVLVDENFKKFVNDFELARHRQNNNNFDADEKILKELKERVDKKIHKILIEHNCKLERCWIQKYSPNDYHGLHVHGNGNNYSFVWMIDCTEESSNTIFHNPGYPYVVLETLEVKPEVNKLLFFDGSIPHEVPPNKDYTRLIISGNCTKL